MNVNEFGIRIVFSSGFDLSDADNLKISFTKPDGTALVKETPDVIAPAVDIETTLGLFPANTYAQYTTIDGDIDQTGVWSARVTYDKTSPALHLTSDVATFTVEP